MSLPAASSVDPPPPRSVLAAVLAADPQNRLHAAMVLVGIHRVPVPDVLDLTWPEVHAAARKLLVPGLTVHLDAATMDLLRWHSARQRLDRHRAGPAWQHSLLVFTDQIGRPYSETAADEDGGYEAYDARRAWSTAPSRPPQRLWNTYTD